MERFDYILIMLLFVMVIVSIPLNQQNTLKQSENLQIKQLGFSLNTRILGSSEYGVVVKEGPYGNSFSPVKIAYIVGVHPQESKAHKSLVESLKKNHISLKCCYYIYKVIVTKDTDDYNKGRINGQLLARDYAVPDITKNYFKLAIDVHSNRGMYKERTFLFSPIKSGRSESIAMNIKHQIPWLVYYVPPRLPEPTSTPFVTIPLIKSGVPAIVYETYMYEPYETVEKRANEFISVVDNEMYEKIKISIQIFP
ncbi:MAG: hypothetical protein FJ150_06440 [Euryarchaeota archaeon]|nr:hypothetical protein [Euryarchaeota archaeon]